MKKRIMITIGSIVIVGMIGTMGFFFYQMLQKIEDRNVTISSKSYESETPKRTAKMDATDINTLSEIENESASKELTGQESSLEENFVLEMQSTALSWDGKRFSCYLANALENSYDFYMRIFTDQELKNEVASTGMIPVGSRIEEFETKETMAPGIYDCYLVYTQLEKEEKAVHGNTVVAFTLVVSE